MRRPSSGLVMVAAAGLFIALRLALELRHVLLSAGAWEEQDDGGGDGALPLALRGKAVPDEINITSDQHFLTLAPGEFEARIHPSFANTTRLYFDVNFARLHDKYGLIDVEFTDEELLYVFKRIVEIWAQANIHPRIWLPRALERVDIGEGEAEAYRVLITAPKRRDHPDFTAYRQQLARSAWGVENTRWMYREMLRVKNAHCCDIERQIVGANRRTGWNEKMVVSVYAAHYFRWYNAVALGSFIMIRGGSCWKNENKILDGKPVQCRMGYMDWNGSGADAYGARVWEQYPFTPDHFVRIMAHEIGHFLDLVHPFHGKCTEFKSFADGLLMAQQRKITIPGGKCSRRTAALESLRLQEEEIERSREWVKKLDGVALPSQGNITRLGLTVHQLPFTVPLDQEGFDVPVVFPNLEVPCAGRVVRARLTLSSATPPVFGLLFFSALGDTVLATEAVTVDLMPYLHNRHAEIDLSLSVENGSRIGVAPRKLPGHLASDRAVVHPVFAAKRLKKPLEHWRPVVLDLSRSPGRLLPESKSAPPHKRDAYRGSLAWLINFDVQCVDSGDHHQEDPRASA